MSAPYVLTSHNMVNFGPLAAEIGWRVWGTPGNFNGFRVLAALLHGTSGRQPNFEALNRGRHLYSAGRPSRWALAHILVCTYFLHCTTIACFNLFLDPSTNMRIKIINTRMWADAQRDGRQAGYRWRPLRKCSSFSLCSTPQILADHRCPSAMQ